MKTYILIILVFCLGYTVNAQEFSQQKFNAMTLNGMTMNELFTQDISWSFFKQKMGNPTQEYTSSEMEGEFQMKHFVYNGAHFYYSDYLGQYDFFRVEITNASYSFLYDGFEIKVGNNISGLSSKFPQQYSDRLPERVSILHELADNIVMRIYYDQQGVITKIELREDFV